VAVFTDEGQEFPHHRRFVRRVGEADPIRAELYSQSGTMLVTPATYIISSPRSASAESGWNPISAFRNPNYHLPTDRMDTLDFRFMAELVKSLATFLAQPR
jgi:hypothetical protein